MIDFLFEESENAGILYAMERALSNLLESLRRTAGISRAKGAERSGVSRMTLFRWERGDNIPHEYELRAVLDAYGASPAQRSEIHKARERETINRMTRSGRPASAPQVQRGDLLAALRGRAGLTQAEVAVRAEVTRFALSAWENMRSWPDDATLHRVAYVLDATESELLALTTPPTPQMTSDDRSLDALYHDTLMILWGWPPLEQCEPEILRLMARLRPLAPQFLQARTLLTELLYGYSIRLTSALRPQESAHWLRRANAVKGNGGAPYELAWRAMARAITQKEVRRRAHPRHRRRAEQELWEEQRSADDAIDGAAPIWRIAHRIDMAMSLHQLGDDDSALRLAASAFALTQTAERTQPEMRLAGYGELLHATGKHDIIADLFPAYLGRSDVADAHIRYYLGLAARAHGDPSADALLNQALAAALIQNRLLLARDIRQSLIPPTP